MLHAWLEVASRRSILWVGPLNDPEQESLDGNSRHEGGLCATGPSRKPPLRWGCQVPVLFTQGQPHRASLRYIRKWRMCEARKGGRTVVYKGTPQNLRGSWRGGKHPGVQAGGAEKGSVAGQAPGHPSSRAPCLSSLIRHSTTGDAPAPWINANI